MFEICWHSVFKNVLLIDCISLLDETQERPLKQANFGVFRRLFICLEISEKSGLTAI